MQRIGLISDTHGLLRPQAMEFLRGCDHIVHGGDIGAQHVLDALAAIAPLTAVRGNNDGAAWADAIRETEHIELGGVWLYAIHDLARLDIDPAAEGIRVVVSGHSHRPVIEEREGVLYINPGSAGPRRFRLPISVGELIIEGGAITPRIVEMDTASPAR
ncbi:phosphodiesterase [Variovorax sp. SRS16]|uniref:metallophosphoesterase family protein n=1 Tax=Variovorax sp. SRS16 TaxID=282217 RepID=UPI001317D1F2|nr:metallophosphoesterase family protein [Variovorax sp. SRS16]VTU13071.1 phosphodiesterase [Variovorax sp. SRS16]